MINPGADTSKVRSSRRRRRRLRRRLRRTAEILFLVAIVALVVSVLVRKNPTPAGAPRSDNTAPPGPATKDVELGRCGYKNFTVFAPLTITNHSAVALSYVITVDFTDGDRPFGEAVATSTKLRGGRTAKIVASGVANGGNPTNLNCKVTDITRFAS